MGIFEEVTGAVGRLALTARGWRIVALVSVTLLCAAAYGVQKLVVVVLEADRQSFIDRDASNASAVKAVDAKIDLSDLRTTKSIKTLSDRSDTLEKEFIELHTDVRWIRQTMQKWETPPPSTTPK